MHLKVLGETGWAAQLVGASSQYVKFAGLVPSKDTCKG